MLFSYSLAFLLWCQFLLLLFILCLSKWTFFSNIIVKGTICKKPVKFIIIGEKNIIRVAVDCC